MIIDSKKYSGACACGKTHLMQTKLSVIESGCLKNAADYFKKCGISGKIVTVYDENTYKATADRHITADCEVILNPENLHANEHGVDLLKKELPQTADVLVAVGSGTIHDITRYCAYECGAQFVSCPTAASVDGFCSSVAAMTWHGCKKTLTAVAPTLVLADIDIIKNAPIRLAKSGFGDMVGKYIALTDWKIGNILKGEYYCEKIADMTLSATKSVIDSAFGILEQSEQSYINLIYGLLMSGLAMQMLGNSRCASGAEHHISHIIEMEPKGLGVHSDALHGEKVGVGTLLALKEYKRICALDNIEFCDYTTYTDEFIYDMFSENMGKEILDENKTDACDGITAEMLSASWDKICAVIDALPDADELNSLYKKLDIISTLSQIGVNEDLHKKLLDYCPTVRNRLTLMRLRKCIKNIRR